MWEGDTPERCIPQRPGLAPPSWKEEEDGDFMGWVGVEGVCGCGS